MEEHYAESVSEILIKKAVANKINTEPTTLEVH